jgi:cytochrome c biogenesis protein CcmG, thiol:disulfide interchange protein DsbE
MTIRQQWGIVAATVALIAVALTAAVVFLGDELFHVTVGSRAPDIHAVTLDPEPAVRTLADYDGRVVLLNVWATWCEPCRVEMPSMEALHRDYAPHGLSVVAVSIDQAGSRNTILAFADSLDLTFDILHDPVNRIQRDYQGGGVPETFVIGRDGIIRRKWWGAEDWNSPANRALIAQLVGAPAPDSNEIPVHGDVAPRVTLPETGAR